MCRYAIPMVCIHLFNAIKVNDIVGVLIRKQASKWMAHVDLTHDLIVK